MASGGERHRARRRLWNALWLAVSLLSILVATACDVLPTAPSGGATPTVPQPTTTTVGSSPTGVASIASPTPQTATPSGVPVATSPATKGQGGASPVPQATTATVVPSGTRVDVAVDDAKRYQTIEGFGATHIPLVYEGLGDTLGPELRAKAMDAVYRQVGISTGNVEGSLLESPAGFNERANDDDDPFHFNWRGFSTKTADATKAKLIDLAKPLGFDNFVLSQKVNVRWASPWLDRLRGANYDRYLDEAAEQVAAGLIYWRDTHGIVPRYVMPFNEPTTGNREFQNGTAKDVTDIVKRAGARLRREGFTSVKFVIPNEETVQATLETARTVLSDPDARQYVGAIGYHPYPYGSPYSSVRQILRSSGAGSPDSGQIALRNRLRDLGREYGVPVWMTEVSHGEVDPRSFDNLRGRAIHIHDEFVYADAAAYFGMNSMWDTTSHKLHFDNTNVFSEEGTIVLIENATNTVHISGTGYAIGHYARWVKRGAVRIEATSSDARLQVTAFRDDGQQRLTLVIINNANAPRAVQVGTGGLMLSGSLTGEQSTATAVWQTIGPTALDGSNGFALTVPAESVTTVVGQIATR